MSRLAARVKRLEGSRAPCLACGGVGGLCFVLDGQCVPERAGCARCGRGPLIMRLVEITKEEFDAQQSAGKADRAA